MRKPLHRISNRICKRGALFLASVMLLTLCSGCGSGAGGTTGGTESGTGTFWTREPGTVEPSTVEPSTIEPTTIEPIQGRIKDGDLVGSDGKPLRNQVILVVERSNYAEGIECHGIAITSMGRLYSYDFGGGSFYPDGGSSLGDKLNLLVSSVAPSGTVDQELLAEIYEYGMKINTSAKMNVVNEACDYGENSIIFRNPETGELITCYEQGDNTGYLEDENAKKLADLWMDERDQAIQYTDEQPDRLFIGGDIPMDSIHSGRIELDDSSKKYFIAENDDALRRFAKEKGFDVEPFLSGMEEYWKNADKVYFLQVNNVVNTGVDFKTAGILFGDGSFRFLESPDNRYEEDGEVDPSRLDGYIYIAAFPTASLEMDASQCLTERGEPWIVLK